MMMVTHKWQAGTVSSVMDAFSNQGFKTESVDVHIAKEKDKVPSAKEPICDDTPVADTYFWPIFHCRYQFKFSVSNRFNNRGQYDKCIRHCFNKSTISKCQWV